MSNPWGVSLKKTGLNQQRLSQEESSRANLEENQANLKQLASENTSKMGDYDERQASLAADAMAGQQGRLPGQGGRRKSRRHRKSSRKHRKHRKTRRHHRRH